MINDIRRIAKKFVCLEGVVAIIFCIFTFYNVLHGAWLSALLMGIFSYWWVQRVLGSSTAYSSRGRFGSRRNRGGCGSKGNTYTTKCRKMDFD